LLDKNLLVHIVLPKRCDLCGDTVTYSADICDVCNESLPFIDLDKRCKKCGCEKTSCCCYRRFHHYKESASAFYYDGCVKTGIIRLKINGYPDGAETFAKYMFETVKNVYGDILFDMISYVPLSKGTLKRRGFNQSRLLADKLSNALDIPDLPLLEKLYDVNPQRRMTAQQRKANIFGVFDVCREYDINGKTILLVDDVITTGATVGECAVMLKIYGAAAVYVITAAATKIERQDS